MSPRMLRPPLPALQSRPHAVTEPAVGGNLRAMNRPPAATIDYSSIKTLVIDSFPGMRSALRNILSLFGMVTIDMASSAADAIVRVRGRPYDLILSDYSLGDGQDGQQLLEQLRHTGLISLDTAFVMVTAESYFEQVVATAELIPDDYLIKPFNADSLHNRLDVILRRKSAFAAAYAHYAKGALKKAVAACDDLIRSQPRYVVDAMRFKGELLLAGGSHAEAEALYRQVIDMRAVPWARLGIARSLHRQGRLDDSARLLAEVIETAPDLVAAYDLQADVQLARKDTAGAQASLQQGVAISGRTVRRQQRLGEVAYDNRDLEVARKACAATLDKGRHSIFVGTADYANLCRVQVEQGDLDAALGTLRQHKSVLQGNPEGRLATAVVEGMVHTRAGRADDAGRALDEAQIHRQSGARGDERLLLDLASACMVHGRHEEGDAIVGEVARNAHDSEALLARMRKLYADAGRVQAGAGVLAQATESVRRLNNEGAILAQKGNLTEALARMFQAADEAPYNPRVAMNAAWIALRCIDLHGLNPDVFERARGLVGQAERLAPGHVRLIGLHAQIREVETRLPAPRR